MVDSENRIYEDIDHNSTGGSNSMVGSEMLPDSLAVSPANATDSGFSSGQTSERQNHHVPCGSDDSRGSGEFETFSSDDDRDDDSEKVHSPTYEFLLTNLILNSLTKISCCYHFIYQEIWHFTSVADWQVYPRQIAWNA